MAERVEVPRGGVEGKGATLPAFDGGAKEAHTVGDARGHDQRAHDPSGEPSTAKISKPARQFFDSAGNVLSPEEVVDRLLRYYSSSAHEERSAGVLVAQLLAIAGREFGALSNEQRQSIDAAAGTAPSVKIVRDLSRKLEGLPRLMFLEGLVDTFGHVTGPEGWGLDLLVMKSLPDQDRATLLKDALREAVMIDQSKFAASEIVVRLVEQELYVENAPLARHHIEAVGLALKPDIDQAPGRSRWTFARNQRAIEILRKGLEEPELAQIAAEQLVRAADYDSPQAGAPRRPPVFGSGDKALSSFVSASVISALGTLITKNLQVAQEVSDTLARSGDISLVIGVAKSHDFWLAEQVRSASENFARRGDVSEVREGVDSNDRRRAEEAKILDRSEKAFAMARSIVAGAHARENEPSWDRSVRRKVVGEVAAWCANMPSGSVSIQSKFRLLVDICDTVTTFGVDSPRGSHQLRDFFEGNGAFAKFAAELANDAALDSFSKSRLRTIFAHALLDPRRNHWAEGAPWIDLKAREGVDSLRRTLYSRTERFKAWAGGLL